MKFNLKELQAKHLPQMKADTFASIPETATAEEAANGKRLLVIADEYFKAFVLPQDGKCIGCGSVFQAKNLAEGFIFSTFRWGLAHGEAFCNKCGYPARVHHEIPELGRIQNLCLQYHPDALEVKECESEAA